MNKLLDYFLLTNILLVCIEMAFMARNKYPEETVQLILSTAARLFVEKGYEHTSIQDIINHLGGLSKGAIYHHFKSKEEILIAVVDQMCAGIEEMMAEICENPNLTGKEKLRQMFWASINRPGQEKIFRTAPNFMDNSRLFILMIQDVMQEIAPKFIQPVIEAGVQDGSIQTKYPQQFAEVSMLLTNIWLNPLIFQDNAENLTNKFYFLKHMFQSLGVDMLEDEMLDKLLEFCTAYQKNQ